tara:strand:- start:120 stop:1493 length:1374 start_codon:yes stop_codon:yes gene_type:complete
MIILNNLTLKLLQILVYLFPLSFIFGNFAINIFVILIILLGLYYYKTFLFKWYKKENLIILTLFFLTILLSSYYQNFFVENSKDTIKSILYLRYFFLILVIRSLIIKNQISLNIFLISCFVVTCIVSIDIFAQFLFGKNLLGYSVQEFSRGVKYYTGIFGLELIAGGFILMFSTLGIFSIFNIIKTNKKIIYLVIFAFFVIFFLLALILAGNRMPLLMYTIFLISFAIVYKKKEKIYFLSLAILAFALLIGIIFNSDTLRKRASNFYVGIPNPVIIVEELRKEYPNLKKYENSGRQFHTLEEFKTTKNYRQLPFWTGHIAIYLTSIDLILDKPLIGGGIKSFRNQCSNKLHLPNRVCESHPHNYVLEILNDTGLLGFLLIHYLVIYLLLNNYKDYKLSEKFNSKISNWIYLAIILSLFIHFFPIKSSGSFFSTFNSAFIFLILGISFGINELKYKKS